MRIYRIFLVLMVFFAWQLNLNAQCTPAPPSDTDCLSGCTTNLVNNADVGAGQIHCYTGSGTVSSVSMNGGTIRVCGTLSINTINFNSGGTIIITSTGSLTFTNGFNMNSNCIIVNYGSLSTVSVSMQNGNNFIYNYGTFNQSGTLSFGNLSASFINGQNATANVNSISKGGGSNGTLCIEAGSSLNVETFSNAQANFVSYGSGIPNGCIRMITSATSSAALTSSSSVEVCLATGVGAGQNWGSASVTTDCATCADVLPVTLASFDARLENGLVKLIWSTALELNNDYFAIERSKNGFEYHQIGQIKGAGNSISLLNYSFIDEEIPDQEIMYYRLKQVDRDGSFSYSEVRSIRTEQLNSFGLYPNPASDYFIIEVDEQTSNLLSIFTTNGQLVTQIEDVLPNQRIDVSKLPRGTYVIKMLSNNKLKMKRFTKQ